MLASSAQASAAPSLWTPTLASVRARLAGAWRRGAGLRCAVLWTRSASPPRCRTPRARSIRRAPRTGSIRGSTSGSAASARRSRRSSYGTRATRGRATGRTSTCSASATSTRRRARSESRPPPDVSGAGCNASTWHEGEALQRRAAGGPRGGGLGGPRGPHPARQRGEERRRRGRRGRRRGPVRAADERHGRRRLPTI